MAEIKKAGESGSLGHLNTSQGQFRTQIDALTDAVRQLGGNPIVKPGDDTVNDPLNAPYILYVNSYTGSDKFVSGDYSTADDGTFAAKMRRISNQRLECGYTEARPFKTISRAVIEAGIITSRDYLTLGKMCGDNVTIVVMSGTHEACNGPGTAHSSSAFPDWQDGKEPTVAELQSFNAPTGGLILPRSVSIISQDLRKARISPCYVPTPENEKDDLSNRSAIFKMTGGCYFYGFSFVDKIVSAGNTNRSHHLLTCFEFASKAELDEFYSKIWSSFKNTGGIKQEFAVTRNYENQIVGPQPPAGQQDENTDTTKGSSPYIYNCSIRSDYGLCGILVDGADTTGFRSALIAQYTGISLQRDMRAWEYYDGAANSGSGSWEVFEQSEYNDYITTTPNNVRPRLGWRSFHCRARNRAIVQEVSVFAIGQAVHHWTEAAGELTVTNSSSNFGGVAALAEGYNPGSFATDKNWNVGFIKTAVDMESLRGQITRVSFGKIADTQANNGTNITLEEDLEGKENNKPTVCTRDGYSLDNYGGTSYVWIENPNGPDYYAELDDTAWSVAEKNKIKVKSRFKAATTDSFPTNDDSDTYPPIAGKRMFIRRLRDTRTIEARRYSLLCNNTATDSRNIVRDYVLQTDTESAAIDREIEATETIVASNVAVRETDLGVQRTNEIQLRRACASSDWDKGGAFLSNGYHKANNYYRRGDVVRYKQKHWKCIEEHIADDFDPKKWDESHVHTDSAFGVEDFFKNIQPVIIFDKDLDNTREDDLLGYKVNDLGQDEELMRQVRTATDYLGMYSFLRSLGFNDARSHKILEPKPEADRVINPQTSYDGIPSPSGCANSWANWEIQFRRPSNIRLFGHAYEFSGTLNYTKALPQYQRDLTASNKFSYYFTDGFGGRCYVSGFNEEGFQVTPAGITDLQTGELLSPEDIGAERDPNAPVVFNGDVVVQGTLTVGEGIETDQKSRVLRTEIVEDDDIKSDGRGMSWIAPMGVITDVEPNEAFELDGLNDRGENQGAKGIPGYSGPSFVTPYFLDTWRGKNRLLSSQPGPVYIFINPRGVEPAQAGIIDVQNNESSNALTNSINELLGNPPTRPQSACRTLAQAVEYADATINTATEVVYYCGPGLYWEEPEQIDFRHPVRIVGYSLKENRLLHEAIDWLGTTDGGRGPGRSGKFPAGSDLQDEIESPDNKPCFLTRVRWRLLDGFQTGIILKPLNLRFEQDSELRNIAWWGPKETFRAAQGERGDESNANRQRIPNSFWQQLQDAGRISAANLDTISRQNNDNIINYAFYYILNGAGNLNHLQINGCMTVNARLRTENVLITALGFATSNQGRGDDEPVIQCEASAVLEINGLTMMGNNAFNGTASVPGAARPTFRGQSDYDLFGFMRCFASMANTASNGVLSIAFGYRGRFVNEGFAQWNYNVTQVNWHLLTNNGNYPTDTQSPGGNSVTTNRNQMGPGFESIFGRNVKQRRLLPKTWLAYRAGSAARNPGICGFFGQHKSYHGSDYNYPNRYNAATLSYSSSWDARDVEINTAQPRETIPGGTIWTYELRPSIFKRNEVAQLRDGPSVQRPRFDQDPLIMSNIYTYGPDDISVGVKYAPLTIGLDYIYNFQSNRALYG